MYIDKFGHTLWLKFYRLYALPDLLVCGVLDYAKHYLSIASKS